MNVTMKKKEPSRVARNVLARGTKEESKNKVVETNVIFLITNVIYF